jgi:hypothetical protein
VKSVSDTGSLRCVTVYLFDCTVEFAVITLDPATKKPKSKIYRPAEVDVLLEKQGVMKKEDEDMK